MEVWHEWGLLATSEDSLSHLLHLSHLSSCRAWERDVSYGITYFLCMPATFLHLSSASPGPMWWVMSWTVNLVLERLGQGNPIYPSVWSSSSQPWNPGCFSLSFSVNSVPHQYGVGKKKKGGGVGGGLLATILCKLSYLLKARDLVSLKVWGFFIVFKSPLCNKSVFFLDVYFLGTSAVPCYFIVSHSLVSNGWLGFAACLPFSLPGLYPQAWRLMI